MNIEHLRRALKSEWLTYYRTNRDWIIKLGVWVNCQGERRPSSSFILGVLSSLEPQLTQLLPLVVDLNCNPDRIVTALGLNFNPEDELAALEELEAPPTRPRPITHMQTGSEPAATHAAPKLLPSSSAPVAAPSQVAPYLEAVPLSNPFAQPGPFVPPANSARSQPAPSQPEQSQLEQSQPEQSQLEPSKPTPTPQPRTVAPATRRTLDTAQLHARELPNRDTSVRRSRNRRS